MSRKKNVEHEYLLGDVPAPSEQQQIAQSLGSRGGNVIEVQFEDGSTTLCLLPSKFNKKVWVRKGGLVIVEETVLEETTAKVTGTIIHVLYAEQLKSLRRQGVRIPDFNLKPAVANSSPHAPDAMNAAASDSDDSLPGIPSNPNRPRMQQFAYEASSGDEDD